MIVGFISLAFSGLILYRTWSHSNTHTEELLRTQTRLGLQFDLAIRQYVSESIRPFAEQHVGQDEFYPETMSTSFVARSIFEKVRQEFPDYIIKFSSDDPRNPRNQAGAAELEVIQYFNDNPEVKDWFGEIEVDGKKYQARFAARRMKESCLRCHGEPSDAPKSLRQRYGDKAGFHRPVGEVVALDTVAIPIDKYKSAAFRRTVANSLVLLIGLGLVLGGIYLTFHRLIIRRLIKISKHFQDAVEQKDISAIRPIKYRHHDEIGLVTSSFNEMAEKLREGYELLEQRVSERTADLESEIAERNKAEEEIQRQNNFLTSIIESLTHPFYVIDARDYTIKLANSASGQDTSNENTTCYALTHHRTEPCQGELICPLQQVKKTKKSAVVDHIHYDKDGNSVNVEVHGYPILDEHGEVAQMIEYSIDISERKKLESQLLQAQKLESIGQLASGIAHEINTPAQYVGDNARFLQESFQDIQNLIGKHQQLLTAHKSAEVPAELIAEIDDVIELIDIEYLLEEIPQAIKQMLEGIDRVSSIVRAMKEFSHPGAEGKADIDINRAIESTITVARNEWKYVAEMETDFDENLTAVPCLAGEFNQVILNIIINAAQAITQKIGKNSDAKGLIAIATRQIDDWVEIRIRDTGGGIPPEIQSKIFDPFFTTKQVGQGSGQGLAISRSVIVEKHGGAIDFETETGAGTTFIIRLPMQTEPNTQNEEVIHGLQN